MRSCRMKARWFRRAGLPAFTRRILWKADLSYLSTSVRVWALSDGLMLERKYFFDTIVSEDALNIMRLYVQVGQDPEKLAELIAQMQD